MMAPKSLKELRAMSEDDLVTAYDTPAQHTQVGLEFYKVELDRRSLERQTTIVTRLTWVIAFLTSVLVILTIVLLKH